MPLLAALFPQFASRLIRNGATLGGNLGTASPIGDSPPVLLALDACLVLAGIEGEREVPLADFFTGYRTTVRRADELIRAIRIPLPLARITAFHKIAKRRFDDISSVAVAVALDLDEREGSPRRRSASAESRPRRSGRSPPRRRWSGACGQWRRRGGGRGAGRRGNADGRPPGERPLPGRHAASSLLKFYAENPDRDDRGRAMIISGGALMTELSARPADPRSGWRSRTRARPCT